MKLFGNSKHRSGSERPKPVAEALTQDAQSAEPRPQPEKKTGAEKKSSARGGHNPRSAMILFGISVAIFVGVVIMCLTLVQRSGENSFVPPENEVKELEYVVSNDGEQPVDPSQPTQPMPELTPPEGKYDSDILNILFFSADSDTQRTDCMMLMNINLSSKDISLLSLPRDTYISGNYELPKLQQVYYAAEGGDRGAQALLEKTKEMLGFWPDYYFVLDQSALSLMVELAGGSVEFELPSNPSYTDLGAGKHSITGASAMELLQYRDDFAQIETDSAKIQRDFFVKLLRQLLNHTSDIMATAQELSNVVDTDLTELDLAYLVDFLKKAKMDSVYSTCLPGKEIQADGGSFFQVDIEKAVTLLNGYFIPNGEEVSIYSVNFRQLTGESGEGQYSDFGFPTTPTTTKPTQGSMPNPTETPTSEGNGEPSELPELPDEPTQAPTESPDPPADPEDTP